MILQVGGDDPPRCRKELEMKKTQFTMMVSSSQTYSKATFRRVWQDDNGDYFVKVDGQLRNVTFAKDSFIPD